MPWEILSALEEVFGALKTTGISTAQIANMWSVKGGSLGWLGLQCPAIDTEDLSGVELSADPKESHIIAAQKFQYLKFTH
ncbi:hypothetical protein Tco_0614853 [Tanacetum coccineum]